MVVDVYLKTVFLILVFTFGVAVGKFIYEPNTIANQVSTIAQQNNFVAEELRNKTTELIDEFTPLPSKVGKDQSVAVEVMPIRNIEIIQFDDSSDLTSNQYWQQVLYAAKDESLKTTAIDNLVLDGAYNELASGLSDSSIIIQQKTIIGLAQIGTSDSIRIIGQLLFTNTSIANRQLAINVLEDNSYFPYVHSFLTHSMNNDPEASIRERAATALGLVLSNN